MAAISGLTSDAANGRASSSSCWTRRGSRSKPRAAAKHASATAQYGPLKEIKRFKRMSTRRRGLSSRNRTASTGHCNNVSSSWRRAVPPRKRQQPDMMIRKWDVTEEQQLSQLILAFKLNNGRLPAGVLSSDVDRDFWTACLHSDLFHGRFTYKQMREKMRRLHHRFMQLSSGHAKSIRPSEKLSYNTWLLITAPPSAPLGGDAAADAAAGVNLHSDQINPSTPAIIYPPHRHVQSPDHPPAPSAHYSPLHQAAPPTSSSSISTETAKENGGDGQLQEMESQRYSVEHDALRAGNGCNDEDMLKAVEAAAATAITCSSHSMQEKLGQGYRNKNKGHSSADGQTQYEKKDENMGNGDANLGNGDDEASSGGGGGGRGEGRAEESTRLLHCCIVDLASATKVIAEATISTTKMLAEATTSTTKMLVDYATSTNKVLGEATGAASSASSVLAHTSRTLAQVLLNHGAYTSGAI